MKKLLIALSFCATLAGCNYQLIDTHYSYDYAIVSWADGEEKIEIKSWKDYEDGDQIQITAVDGKTYLFHAQRIVLVKE